MKIKFENGSSIETIDTKEEIKRRQRAKIYPIDDYKEPSVCDDCEIGDGWECQIQIVIRWIFKGEDMSYLYTGERGIPLKEIINHLGNKNYYYIECRCKWIDRNNQEQDDFFGACTYIDGILAPLDGDSYSLDDLYVEWEESSDDGRMILTVWKYGGE